MGKLTKQQDAFGREIYDHYMGKRVSEIVERDDGEIAVSGGPDVYFAEHRDWSRREKAATRLARGRVLDVGCGAGRVALYLQGRGLEAVGIDNSALAIKVCKQRGLRHARVMSITDVSRRKLGVFDTILMYGNNFGLFGTFKRARWLLRRFRNMTSPRGRIIAQTLDPLDTDDPRHLAYHRRNRRRGRMPGQARIRVRYLDYCTPWFDYLLVSRDEMRKIVHGTGWKISRFFDSKGSVYIAVLEKEDTVFAQGRQEEVKI